jgi:copper(I)-binding protein
MHRSRTGRAREDSRQEAAGRRASYAPRVIGFGILIAALVFIGIGLATAHEYSSKDVTVSHPWARATPGGVKVGGAFLEMKAATGQGDRLVGARSPAAGAVELHSHVMEKGIAKMRRVDAIALRAGASVVLKPSGYHLMLTGLHAPLKEGDLLKLTLVFEKAGEIEVDATVEPVGAMGPHGFDRQPGTAPKATGAHKH